MTIPSYYNLFALSNQQISRILCSSASTRSRGRKIRELLTSLLLQSELVPELVVVWKNASSSFSILVLHFGSDLRAELNRESFVQSYGASLSKATPCRASILESSVVKSHLAPRNEPLFLVSVEEKHTVVCNGNCFRS